MEALIGLALLGVVGLVARSVLRRRNSGSTIPWQANVLRGTDDTDMI